MLQLYFMMCRRRASSYVSSLVGLCPWSIFKLRRQHSHQKLAMVFLLLHVSAMCASLHVEWKVWKKGGIPISGSYSKNNFKFLWLVWIFHSEQGDVWLPVWETGITNWEEHTPQGLAIPIEYPVAIYLWCLASSVQYRTVAHLFGVSWTPVCLILCDVNSETTDA